MIDFNPVRKWGAPVTTALLLTQSVVALGATTVSLYSGTFDGEHPAPAIIGKAARGDRFQIEVGRVSALVNYSEAGNPVIVERVKSCETGAVVNCPYFIKLDGSPMGTRVNTIHTAKSDHKAICDDGSCTGFLGKPIPKEMLLFGKYDLPKITTTDGKDFGFLDTHRETVPVVQSYPIACPEFSLDRIFTDMHFFDWLLIIANYREQEMTDLDLDFRKIYFTVENERHDQVNCPVRDLFDGGDVVRIDDLKDCVLPVGNQFTLYAQSRFFLKDTRPCGKFVTKGVKNSEGYQPDWFMGWYECDGKVDRTPIEKQFTYATRIELKLTQMKVGGQ